MRAGDLALRWNALPRAVRMSAAAAFCILCAVGIALFVGRPGRAALYAAPLHPEQVAEVEERLAGWNVSFIPTADNLLVDGKQRNDLLLKLSLAGVPHTHIESSSDLFGKLGALTPQSVIDEQTRDGLAGDIELGLRGIDGVQDARVIIAPAKPGYFAGDQSADASAGVRLRLAPGARLSGDAVSGIRGYIAAAVPGLQGPRVTIVDDRGVALGDGPAGGDADDMQRSLQSALDAALGAGAAIVRVHLRHSRLSAAIFVDPMRGADLAQVRSLAAATLGSDPAHGDAIDVEAISFNHLSRAAKDGWWLAYGALVPALPTAIVAVAALLALRWSARPAAFFLRKLMERGRIERASKSMRGIAPASVRGVLENEPPHAAAAIISALPAATAAAVLDMYPESERSAIVRRMQRPASPLVSDVETFIASA